MFRYNYRLEVINEKIKSFMADFREADHPRDMDGKFTDKGRNFKKVNFYDIEGLLDNDSDKELIRISKLNDKTKETKKKKMEPYKKLSDAELFQKYKEVTGDKEVTWDVTRNMFKTRSEVREYLAAIISQTLEACAGKE